MGAGPGTLRVSVVGGRERVDLVVPAAVSVAELLPELVRRLGQPDPPSASAEAWLSVLGGPPLDPSAGLADQGVDDGALLTVTTAADHAPTVPVDDLACVVADAVESLPRPAAGAARWAAPAVAAALGGLGAIGVLLLQTPWAAGVSGATAMVLLGVVALAGRRDRSPVPAVAAWLAVAHAGAAGLAAGVAGAGAAAGAAGVVAALVTRNNRTPLWAAPPAGAVLGTVGVVAATAPAPLPVVATCALAAVVVTVDLHPWLAATVAGLLPPPLGEDPPTAPDRDAVAHAVRRAHDVLLVTSVATGLLLAVLGPVVAASGGWAVAVVVLCCGVVGLRSRRHRPGPRGIVGLLSGLVPLVPVAVAVGAQRPEWRLPVVACAAGAGLLVLAAAALPTPRGARAGRGAELLEALALVALPPTALAATGLLDVVRELVG